MNKVLAAFWGDFYPEYFSLFPFKKPCRVKGKEAHSGSVNSNGSDGIQTEETEKEEHELLDSKSPQPHKRPATKKELQEVRVCQENCVTCSDDM